MMCELDERFHVGVIGGGIAGLAAAQLLVGHSSVRVTVLEGATQLGGRAGVRDGGEHCTRFFLDDYLYMLALMRDVPTASGTLADALVPVQRIVGMNGRLVEVDHAYPAFDAGLRPADRMRLMRSTVTSYLVARRSAANTNSFGHAYNYSLRDLVWIVRNMAGSERARVLSGPTDKEFLEPWAKHLLESGVVIQTDARVGRVIPEPRGARVLGVGLDRRFDAVLVATSASDCADLLDASGLPRLLDWREHANCMCLTINLDPREPVLTDARPRAVSVTGALVLVQPQVSRCVVLVTTLASNDVEDVLSWLRPQLGLQHPVRGIAVRRNDQLADAVFAGSGLDPNLLECKPETLAGNQAMFFAGSYVRNTYVVDSAEGASRSAYNAVGRLLASRPQLADAAGAHASWRQARGLPAAGWATRPASHPNARTQGHLQSGTWWLASWISTAVTVAASRSIHHIAKLPAGRPMVFLAQGDGAFAGYSAMRIFRKLGVRVRPVLPAHIFAGFRGFLLSILGAIPMHENPHATVAALAAAIRAGESVLLPDPEARDLAIRVAATTCVPLVPIIGTAGRRMSSPRRCWRPRVTIIVGAPVEVCLDVGVAGPRIEATVAELARRAETLHSNRR